MLSANASRRPPTLGDYLAVLRRRALVVATSVILVPVLAGVTSLLQDPLYESSAEVLLSRGSLAPALSGLPDLSRSGDPERAARTQARLARTPVVLRRTLRAAGVNDVTLDGLLEDSTVVARGDSDLLVFSVTDEDSTVAVTLANEYARQFTLYRSELETAPLRRARKALEEQIRIIEASDEPDSVLLSRFLEQEQQLRALEALTVSNTSVVRTADTADKIRPRTRITVMIGVLMGAILGVGLAFVAEALDKRIRSVDEIPDELGLPLLGRIPRRATRLERNAKLTMFSDSEGEGNDAFRALRASLEIANLQEPARVITFMSAVEEGSEVAVAANLAIAFARAGQDVTLVDSNLLRPTISDLFGVRKQSGLTDVVRRAVELERALLSVTVTSSGFVLSTRGAAIDHETAAVGERARPVVESDTSRRPLDQLFHAGTTRLSPIPAGAAVLRILPVGTAPPSGAELLGSKATSEVLDELRRREELTLIAGPALLGISDGVALATMADALVVIVNSQKMNRPLLNELRRAVDALPGRKLGVVVTDVVSRKRSGTG